MDNYLQTLNEPQLEAVLNTEGPCMIIAGAGSGKTRVLTYRIAHLIKDKNVDPFSIMALTFTNKAAKEMRERIIAEIKKNAKGDMWRQDKTPFVINEANSSNRIKHLLKKPELKCAVVLPIIRENKEVLGVMSISTHQGNSRLATHSQEMLKSLTGITSSAIGQVL